MNLEVSNPLLGTVHDRDHTYRTLTTLCSVDSCVVRLLRFARTLKMTVNSCYCNRCKYIRVGCGSPHRNKSMGCDTEKLEFELCVCERNRRDIFIPGLYHLLACNHLLFLNFSKRY